MPGRTRFILPLLISLPIVISAYLAPVSAAPAVAQTAPSFRLYASKADDNHLQALDPTTLADLPGAAMKIAPYALRFDFPQIVTNADGSMLTATLYGHRGDGQIHSGQDISIREFVDGVRRGPTIHPAVPVGIEGISPDGSQLYGLAYNASGFYVLDAATGAVRSTVELPGNGYGPYLYDPAAGRLYYLYEPPILAGGAPSTPVLQAYDVANGQLVASLPLPGVRAGGWQDTATATNNDPVFNQWLPGFALSPDGKQLAILDGSTDILTTVDTQTLAVEGTVAVHQAPSLLDRALSVLGLAPGVAEAKQIKGVWLTMTYTPDGRSVVVYGYQGTPNAQGMYQASALDLRRIDVSSGVIQADLPVASSIWSLRFAPDGNALYAVEPMSPTADEGSIVQRLDPATLRPLASRSIDGSSGLNVYLLSSSATQTSAP